MQSEVEHWEVPKENAILIPVGGWNKRHRNWNLATEHHQKPKEWRKLAATSRTTCRAKVAWRKRNFIRKNWTMDKVEREARRVWTHQDGRMGRKDLGSRQPQYLRKETTTNGIGGWSSGQ
jgi:hypothetical protein